MFFHMGLTEKIKTAAKLDTPSPSTPPAHKSIQETIKVEPGTGRTNPTHDLTGYRNIIGAPQTFANWETSLIINRALAVLVNITICIHVRIISTNPKPPKGVQVLSALFPPTTLLSFHGQEKARLMISVFP